MQIAQPAIAAPQATRIPAESSPASLRSGSPRIESLARAESTDPADANDIADPAEANDATEKADAPEPIDPIDANDPTEPIESIDPLEAIERNESSDHSDIELSSFTAPARPHPSARREPA